MREKIFLSDDLYNESVHGYFATPKFHELMRDAFTSRPQGFHSGELERLLDCHTEEFTAYLKSIADDDGIAHVPIGDSECISIDLWDFVDPEEAAEACRKNRQQRALDRIVDEMQARAILRAASAYRAKEKQEREQAESERREKLRQREAILDVVRARPSVRLRARDKLSNFHAFADSLLAYSARWTYRAATGDVLGYAPARHPKLGAYSARDNKGDFLQSFIGAGGAKAPPCVTGLPGRLPMKTSVAASIAAAPPRVYASARRRGLKRK